MPNKESERNTQIKMKKVVETLNKELRGIRTGRASAAILEGIRVDYYGSQLPVNQIANINIPQPRVIEIKVWDANAVVPIEKAIISSKVGLTPNTDGQVIRLNVPSLTTERREELIKRVHIIVEDFRIEIRNIRRDVNNEIKDLKKAGEISEDQTYGSIDNIQKITDSCIEEINQLLLKKEKEIREE